MCNIMAQHILRICNGLIHELEDGSQIPSAIRRSNSACAALLQLDEKRWVHSAIYRETSGSYVMLNYMFGS